MRRVAADLGIVLPETPDLAVAVAAASILAGTILLGWTVGRWVEPRLAAAWEKHAGGQAAGLVARMCALVRYGLIWLVQGMLSSRPVMSYALSRLARRPALAERLGSALGDCRPASDALSPAFLAAVLRP